MSFFGFFNKNTPDQSRTGFENISEQELISLFKSSNWNGIKDIDTKRKAIQELENRNAVLQQRAPARITFDPKELNSRKSSLGLYNDNRNTIYINSKQASFDLLDSYFHESRHAQQRYSPNEVVGDRVKTMCQMEDLPRGDGSTSRNYVGSSEDFQLYRIQISEMDSNNFAADKMLSYREFFQDDVAYIEYLDGRAENFSKANAWCELREHDRALLLNENLNAGFTRGTITEEELVRNNRINCNSDLDVTVCDSQNLQIRLQSVSEEIRNMHGENLGEENMNESGTIIQKMTHRSESSRQSDSDENLVVTLHVLFIEKKRKCFCISHFIRLEDGENIVLQDIRKVKKYERKHIEEFLETVKKRSARELERLQMSTKAELDKV